MFKIAAIILENPDGRFLLYKRDNKPEIPFPGYWDLIGGHVEPGESPITALKREIHEELGIELKEFHFFKEYLCVGGDVGPNVKYIYRGTIDIPIEDITLFEGDYPLYFSIEEIPFIKFANILRSIMMDYISD